MHSGLGPCVSRTKAVPDTGVEFPTRLTFASREAACLEICLEQRGLDRQNRQYPDKKPVSVMVQPSVLETD